MAPDDKIFVGRETELEQFRLMLKDSDGKERILLLLGGGGIGKTKIVNKMLEVTPKAEWLAPKEAIDLFSTDYRHIDGLQRKIKELIENLTEGKPSPFADWIKNKADTSEKFYECLKAFCVDHPLVLAFDTFENLDKVASNWIFKGEPNGLQVPNLICIVAGREKDDIELYQNNLLTISKEVSGFTLKEADDFFLKIVEENKVKNRQKTEEKDPYDDLLNAAGLAKEIPTRNSVEWVVEITKGHPLRLEMVFRWLGTLLGDESLKGLTTEKFDERLMVQVREFAERGQLDVGFGKKISQPVYETLLCMAHVTRRFDEGFLQYLVDKGLIYLQDPNVTKQDIISTLEKYFFVKVREGHSGHDIIQLHDEMARLVREYVWPHWDNSGEKKQALLTAAKQYYDQLIAQQTGEEADTLRVEKLYYTLLRDSKEGLRQWLDLAELGNENINKLLPGEIRKYLTPNYFDVETLVEIRRTIAEMEQNAGHLKQAVGHWEEVKGLGEENQREDWVVDALIGMFNCNWMVNPEDAHQYLEHARKICEKSFPKRLAFIYYEIGFAYRQMQNLKEAVKWYELGFRQFQDTPGDASWQAILFNDTGYVYLQLGRWGEATRNLKDALDIRKAQLHSDEERLRKASPEEDKVRLNAARSQSALFAGLSHNTSGEFHRYVGDLGEALEHYNEAHKLFVEVGNYFWQAKCLCARGETHRRLARHARGQGLEDAVIQAHLDQSRQDIEGSLYLCEKYQLDDERDTACRRLGRLSHDLGMAQENKEQAIQYFEAAHEYFVRGLGFARQTREVLEELENLTELAFLADDAIDIYGSEKATEKYLDAVDELAKALEKHENDPRRIYQYPVFVALLKMERAAIAYTNRDYEKALDGYVDAFKELGKLPGYGHARYGQHFDHLRRQITNLPSDEQGRWCKRFVEEWKGTAMPEREGRTLADDLRPDLVTWCNRLLQNIK